MIKELDGPGLVTWTAEEGYPEPVGLAWVKTTGQFLASWSGRPYSTWGTEADRASTVEGARQIASRFFGVETVNETSVG